MESSSLALELYFEHRNYVPAMLLAWPLARWLTSDGPFARFKPILAIGVLLLLATEAWFAASLWGAPQQQALVWAAQNPDSPRAQLMPPAPSERLAGIARRNCACARHLRRGRQRFNLPSTCFMCAARQAAFLSPILRLQPQRCAMAINVFLVFNWMSEAIDLAREQKCAGLGWPQLEQLIGAARQNVAAGEKPRFRQDLLTSKEESRWQERTSPWRKRDSTERWHSTRARK